MTKSMTTTQNRFAEIEVAIRRQQQAIKQHQEELTNINDRTLTTLSLVQTTVGDVLQLTEDTRRQFTEIRNEIRREAAAQAAAQQIGFDNMAALFHRLTNTTAPTPPADHESTQSVNDDSNPSASNYDDDDASEVVRYNMSTATMETDNQSSTHARSPAKKRNKRKTRNPTLNSLRQSIHPSAHCAQEVRAHYDSDSTPDDGEL
jgi:hypothetical protein